MVKKAKPPCRYFQKGTCNQGSNCAFPHIKEGGSPFASPDGRGEPQSPLSVNKKYDRELDELQMFLRADWYWPFSSYAPSHEAVHPLIKDRDVSYEELRASYYEANETGNGAFYLRALGAATASIQELREFLLKDINKAKTYVEWANNNSADKSIRPYLPVDQLNNPLNPGCLAIAWLQGRKETTQSLYAAIGAPETTNTSANYFRSPQEIAEAAAAAGPTAAVTPFGGANVPALDGAFGGLNSAANQSAFGKSTFGSAPAPGFGASRPAFGQSTFGQAPATSPFGQAPAASAFGQPAASASPFGQAQPATASPFGQPATTASAFGQPAAATASAFGQPSAAASPFGQGSSAASPFGQAPAASAFGQPAASASPFSQAQPATASPFGQAAGTTSPFGQKPAQPAFGLASQPASPFGQASSTPAFGQTGQTGQQSAFGQAASSSPFGQAAAKPAFGQSAFGQAPKAQPAQPAAASSPFGQVTSAFGQPAANPSANSSPFGRPAGSAFGQTENKPLAFGQPAAAAGSSAFGQPTTVGFGQAAGQAAGTTSPATVTPALQSVEPNMPAMDYPGEALLNQMPASLRAALARPRIAKGQGQVTNSRGFKFGPQGAEDEMPLRPDELSADERAAFEAPTFAVGRVPEVPPPLEYR
ncbi:uncharacterized protein V1510DRAFT_438521 [Dipodascopsis tothii]|uniref:uncharacterized protein n=1 Tax=Dipodascopsis tothii TaxID=44089 RepID=UPI0034CF59ED